MACWSRRRRDGVRVLTLNRPDALNAFNDELYHAARPRARGSAQRATTSRASCSPAPAARSPRARTSARWRQLDTSSATATSATPGPGFPHFLDTLAAFGKPVIAAVNGIGVGIGMTMLLHVDLAFIATTARLRAPFVPLGVVPEAAGSLLDAGRDGQPARRARSSTPATGSPPTKRSSADSRCARSRPTQLMTETMDARPAHRQDAGRRRSCATKQLVVDGRIDAVRAARAREDAAFTRHDRQPANMEAITAFLEKREPDFWRVVDHRSLSRHDDRGNAQRQGRRLRERRRARVPRASRTRRRPSARSAGSRRSARRRGTACATRPQFSAQSAQSAFAMTTMMGGAQPADQRRQPLPQRVDARVRRRQAPGDGVDPRRRVRLRLGRHAVVRRHAVRAARRRRRRHDQLPARRRSASCTSPTCSAPSSRARATRASSTRSPRSSGCATASPRSAAIPTNVTIFGESAGGGCVGTLLGTPAARGCSARRSPQSGAASWWATRASARPKIAEESSRSSASRAGDRRRAPRRGPDGSSHRRRDRVSAAASTRRVVPPFQPVVDGTSLPEPPLDAIDGRERRGRARAHRHEPHEMTLFTIADPSLGELDDRRRRDCCVAPWSAADAEVARRDYRSRAARTRRARSCGPIIGTDGVFRIPAIRLAEAQRAHGRRVDVPVHVGDAGVRRRPRAFDARARDPVRVRQPRPRARAVHRRRARAPGHRRRDAPGVDRVRADGRPEPRRHPAWPAYDRERRATMRFDVHRRSSTTRGDDRALRAIPPLKSSNWRGCAA